MNDIVKYKKTIIILNSIHISRTSVRATVPRVRIPDFPQKRLIKKQPFIISCFSKTDIPQ